MPLAHSPFLDSRGRNAPDCGKLTAEFASGIDAGEVGDSTLNFRVESRGQSKTARIKRVPPRLPRSGYRAWSMH